MPTRISDNEVRMEAWEKVTGEAKYSDDMPMPGHLTARIVCSPHAHADILWMDASKALSMPGVKAVLTGFDFPEREGPVLKDRRPIARERVRYAGEPVAAVVAIDEATAQAAAEAIQVRYRPLPFVLTAKEAIAPGAPVLHEQLSGYKHAVEDVYPQPGTNIASSYRIRKGDADALASCDVIVERSFGLAPSDHAAMEIRTAQAQIRADGKAEIITASQSPFSVREQISEYFSVPMGKVRVITPYVGGAFGGKSAVMLEHIAYAASRSVGGRPVRAVITREQDMAAAPCRMGLEAMVKLGATREGALRAAEITYWLDCGAYCDIAPYMAKAAAADCTGPYGIDSVSCDSYCVYTNHTYATSYRGFGHESIAFCVERAMDALADLCGIDPLEFRVKNALRPGGLTPTQAAATRSNVGDVWACIEKVQTLSDWQEGRRIQIDDRTVRAKGIACLWKAANPPTDASSGAILTFNGDGSVNLNTGVVEIGSGDSSRLAQMVAAKFRMDIGMVHVAMDVDTATRPKHWKTVASLSEYLSGSAVMRAADDAIAQIKSIAAQALDCAVEDVEFADARAYRKSDPSEYFEFRELVEGYKAPDGTSVGDPVIGRGGFMLKGLSALDTQSGKGRTGPSWTVGAQVVEVELDTVDFTYRLIRASTVMDVGALVNPAATASMIAGGAAMGLSLATREGITFGADGVPKAPNLRSYKLLHIGSEPDYRVDFVETPQLDAPFGTRSFAEHGIIGIPAALGNALSAALGKEINCLPILPENIWRIAKGTE